MSKENLLSYQDSVNGMHNIIMTSPSRRDDGKKFAIRPRMSL